MPSALTSNTVPILRLAPTLHRLCCPLLSPETRPQAASKPLAHLYLLSLRRRRWGTPYRLGEGVSDEDRPVG